MTDEMHAGVDFGSGMIMAGRVLCMRYQPASGQHCGRCRCGGQDGPAPA